MGAGLNHRRSISKEGEKMLTVKFYNFSKKNNSTKHPSDAALVAEVNCVLKVPTSVENPTLNIDLHAFPNLNISVVNYAYIPKFDRFYFVNDRTWLANMWSISLESDYLATFKNAIGSSTQYVLRASEESVQDGYIIDTMYPLRAEREAVLTPCGFENLYNTYGSGFFVVGIINKGAATSGFGAVSYYSMTAAQMNMLKNKILTPGTFGEEIDLTTFNPFQYIASCYWIPFDASTFGGLLDVNSLTFGWWDLSFDSAIAYKITTPVIYFRKSVDLPKHPGSGSQVFKRTSQYTRYTLYSRIFGSQPLPADKLINADSISVRIAFDALTGAAQLFVTIPGTDDELEHIMIADTQLGVEVQLAQIAKDYISGVSAIGSALMGAIGSAVAGNAAGVIANTAAGIASAVEFRSPQLQTSGSTGTMLKTIRPTDPLGYITYDSTDILLLSEFYDTVEEDPEDKGRPVCKNLQIDSIPGFIMCADVHPDFAKATITDKENIISIMEGGFFYE